MQIIVAKSAGFCFGVKRAVDIAEKAAGEEKVFSLGPIIHNPQVVEKLTQKGLIPVQSVHQIKNGKLVIRSHGVGPEVMEMVESNGIDVVDATCPFVRRAQIAVEQLVQEGYQPVIVGDPKHAEVEGLVGWSGGTAWVVENAEQAAQLPRTKKLGVVAQTTQPEANLEEVVKVLQGKAEQVVVHNTICRATRQRQEAAVDLAREVDLMVVIGGYNSANTRKLSLLCEQTGTPTYHVEKADELDRRWFEGVEKVGVTAGASTPDWIIEEVVQKMTEFNQEDLKTAEEVQEEETIVEEAAPQGTAEEVVSESAEEAVEEPASAEPAEKNDTPAVAENQNAVEAHLAENLKEIKRGQIIKGTVVQVNSDEILVDIGAKSEGILPVSELSHRPVEDPSTVVQPGDEIDVFVIKVENEEGHPILSKRRADRKQAWERLEKAHQEGTEIKAEVIEVVKGGLLVDVGLRGFVPASLVERGYVEDLEAYLGKELRLKVIELDKAKNKVVLSQKAVLDEEYERQRAETWDSLEEGQVRKGIVRRLTNFGAFVDLGGVDGLLHVSEISWGRVDHPKDVLAEGQEIEVKVLNVDRQEEKVSLGLKQLLPNPWDTAAEKYPVGTVVQGKVLRIAPFGAFVEVEPGIEGLVHISQLADYHVAKTEDVVSVGDEIPVKVLSVDQEVQRMSLSMREAVGKKEQRPKKEEAVKEPANETTGVKLGDLFGDLFEERNDE